MRKDEIDALEYIEQAFLDTDDPNAKKAEPRGDTSKSAKDAPQPREASKTLVDAIRSAAVGETAPAPRAAGTRSKLKKTEMRAPRPRRRRTRSGGSLISVELEQLVHMAPKNLRFLSSVYDDHVTQKYYSTQFRESREELIHRLLDPMLSLEDAARLLGVCPATVRRYTNRGWLKHHRTKGNQRRFRLSGIVAFVDEHGRNPE
jgi:excisionase family DNA binding protein